MNEMMATHRVASSDYNVGDILNNKGETRKSQKKKNGNNAAGLLLRGLGSMFRFGKHRKSAPSSPESASGPHPLDDAAIITSSMQPREFHERRPSGSVGRPSDVDRHHILRRTLPPDERDRAELGRQMAMAVARQVICVTFFSLSPPLCRSFLRFESRILLRHRSHCFPVAIEWMRHVME